MEPLGDRKPLVLALSGPAFLFSVYCASIPFEAILALHEGVTLARYLGIGSGALLLAHMLGSRRVNVPPPAVFAWTALLAWGASSVFWTANPEQAAQSLWLHGRFVLLYAVAVMYPFSRRSVNQVGRAIMLSGFLAAAFILYLYFNEVTYLESIRASVVLGGRAADPNHAAVSLLLPFSLLLSAALSAGRPRLGNHILPLVTLILAVLVTGSRTGLLGLAVAAVSLLVTHFGQHSRERMKVMAFMAVGATTIWGLWQRLPEELAQRFVLANLMAGGATDRFDIWRTGLKAWWDNPITGYGLGSFGSVHTLWAGYFRVAHNIYLQLLVELGIPGAGLLLIALVLSLKFRSTTPAGRGAMAGLLAMAVASLFLGTLNYDYFWLSLIMVEVVRRVEASQAYPRHQSGSR